MYLKIEKHVPVYKHFSIFLPVNVDVRKRFKDYRRTVSDEIEKAFNEKHTPHQIALSFSIGIFIATLPTLGLGLLLFLVLIKLFDSISSLALMASVVVMNPFIKPVFYLASINVGSLIIEGSIVGTVDPLTVVTYLYLGSLVIASIVASISYVVMLKAVKRYRKTDLHVVQEIEDEIIHKKQE